MILIILAILAVNVGSFILGLWLMFSLIHGDRPASLWDVARFLADKLKESGK